MNYCRNSDSRPSHVRLIFLIAVIALTALSGYAQKQPDLDQNTSINGPQPCSVGTTGAVTYLIKNGVELSVNEDWDCDGVGDAYDNCVGMANPAQTDHEANGVGDVCEAASFVKADLPAKSRSNKKLASRTAKAKPLLKSKTKPKSRTTIAAENAPPLKDAGSADQSSSTRQTGFDGRFSQ